MDETLRHRIDSLLALATNQDWSDHSFNVKKAYICAELSAIVYEDVQEYALPVGMGRKAALAREDVPMARAEWGRISWRWQGAWLLVTSELTVDP